MFFGDWICMNIVVFFCVYMRSLVMCLSGYELLVVIWDGIVVVKKVGFDIIIVEISGIG